MKRGEKKIEEGKKLRGEKEVNVIANKFAKFTGATTNFRIGRFPIDLNVCIGRCKSIC